LGSAEIDGELAEARHVLRGSQDRVLRRECSLAAHEDHSDEEDRFVLLGLSGRLRTLVVCHCYRQAEEVIRLISARKANSIERRQYDDRRMK
jgi:uncharacterized DUF497 family protein